jgi:hypothetical protein
VSQSINLSPAVRGHYVTVLTDIPPQQVNESDESNNVLTVPAEVAARPADLRVVSVSAPTQNFSGENATITWSVRDDGAAVWAGTRLWVDDVYLSPDPTLIPGRALLLGLGATAVMGLGMRERLAAPFLLGAGTLALLAVRHLEPVTEAVPRWASLGLLGLALLVVGITWESRLRNLQSARRYLVALR